MKITVTADKPVDDKLTAKVTVASADVDKAIAKTYKDIAKKYNFQGFRKGHAPRPVIDSVMGREAVLAQATNDVLNAVEPLVLEQLDVVPVGRLSFGDDPALLVQGSDYEAEVTLGVRPTCELSSYDAPTIDMPPEEVTDAEVEWQIKQLLSYQASYEDLDEDRPAAEGDTVSVDIENVEGAGHLAGTNRLLQLNGQQVAKELQDGIVGMKKGETKEIDWTHSHEHKGEVHSHDFKVKVTLNGLKKLVTPELDDEVAKKFGYDTAEAFKDAVKEEVAADKVNQLPSLKEDRVVAEMGKLAQIETVPEAYVNEIFNEIATEFLNQLQRQNMSLDMYLNARGVKSDAFIEDLRAQADERARQSLALDAVAAKMGFEATDEDIKAEFEKAGLGDKDIEQWRSEGRLPAVRDSIKRTKALDWLVENAHVNTVDEVAERLAKEEAGDEAASDAE